MNIEVSSDIRMELTAAGHAQPLLELVDKNRDHLSRFLPWVPYMQTVNDFENYIQRCMAQLEAKTDISFVIYVNNEVAGRIGIHHMQQHNKSGAIGYWLGKGFEGRGIITQCCKSLLTYGFEQLALHRIEIKAASENTRSQAIPKSLQFIYEGIQRQAELVDGRFLDICVYSILQPEWIATKQDSPVLLPSEK